jgi:tRNA(fMet)-specific endonuclease VapC
VSGYLLDTNTCIAWLKNVPSVVDRVAAAGDGRVWLCAPVKDELWFGACNSGRVAENQAGLSRFFEAFRSLPFDDRAAFQCGELRAHLKRLGTPIGPYDAQIAAIARVHGLAVATRNTREFVRVPGLRVEDWQGREEKA